MKQIFQLIIRFSLLLLLPIILTSCTSLKCQYYVGVQEPIKEKDLSEESIWKHGDKVFYVRVIDPETVVASSLDWDNSQKKYIAKTAHVIISKLDDNLFLNIKDEGDDYILRLNKEELDKYIHENLNDLFDYKNAGIITPIKIKDRK